MNLTTFSTCSLCCATILAIAACDDSQKLSIESRINAIETRQAIAGAEFNNLKGFLDAHDEVFNRTTQVDMTGKAYTWCDCDGGRLLLACGGVSPYLDGQKIFLDVGNPLGCTFHGFKIHLRYGQRYPEEGNAISPSYDEILGHKKAEDEWRKTVRDKEVEFPDTLPPSSWTRVELVLTPARADEVGYFEISSLHTRSVSLQG